MAKGPVELGSMTSPQASLQLGGPRAGPVSVSDPVAPLSLSLLMVAGRVPVSGLLFLSATGKAGRVLLPAGRGGWAAL